MAVRVGPVRPQAELPAHLGPRLLGKDPSLKNIFLFPLAPWRLSSTLPTTATSLLTSKMSSRC